MNSVTAIKKSQADLKDKVEDLGHYIGNTPLYPIRGLHSNDRVKIYSKMEWQQFGSSVKARPAYRIIKDAVANEQLDKNRTLLDASSGNTGIAYAHIGAALGIPVTLCLPENASEERKQILKALGVDLRLTSRMGGTDEAQQMAQELYESDPDRFYYADQYGNESNWKAHYHTSGPEIWRETHGNITHFIAGLGTTGTFGNREETAGIRSRHSSDFRTARTGHAWPGGMEAHGNSTGPSHLQPGACRRKQDDLNRYGTQNFETSCGQGRASAQSLVGRQSCRRTAACERDRKRNHCNRISRRRK